MAMHRWTELLADGWQSPDTYNTVFATPPEEPGVYLMLCFAEVVDPPVCVGYVGSAQNLWRRLSGHEIYRRISKDGYWPQRWFKVLPATQIREIEKQYIRDLDPAYNVIGRRRGLR